MYFKTFLYSLLILACQRANTPDVQAQYTITVSAGGFDRVETPVSVTFPKTVDPGVYQIKDQSGNSTLIQVNEKNTGCFIIENLPAGNSKTYTFSSESGTILSSENTITYTSDANTFTFQREGNPVFSYYYRDNNPPEELDDRYKRAGYIHPVYTPSGVPLTNHLDTKIHPHHYGIWSAWTHTEFQGRTPDFWNIQDETGRVEHVDSVEAVWNGPVYGGLKAQNHFVDLTGSDPIIALNEEWNARIYRVSGSSDQPYHIFDLVATHTANTGQPLHLPEYHYGGMAFRGHQQWDDPGNISFLTSRGFDRSNGNETQARWVHIGGEVDGKQVGITILGHPDNFRAPQPVRIHPDIPYMVFAPMQLGDMAIRPGSPYVMRYRYVTYDGEPDVEKLKRLWNDYAYPPGVTVSETDK
jgi:hypothetical protein